MSTNSQLALTNAQRYEALLRISGSLASRTPADLAQSLSSELRSILDFDFLDVLVYKNGTSDILWRAVGAGETAPLKIPSEDTPTWWVYRNQQPLTIADWNEDERFSELRDALKAQGVEIRSVCRLPLTTPHRRLGVFGIASRRVRGYSQEEVRFLSLLADGLALVIDNALNFEASCRAQSELQQQNARLKLLLDLTNSLTSNLDFRELLRAISASVRQVMNCDVVGITLPDSASDNFRLYVLDFPGSKGLIHEELLFSVGDDPGAGVLRTLKPFVENRPDPTVYTSEAYKMVIGEGIKSHCLMPLVSRGRALGLLGLGRLEENSFSEDDVEFLTQVAGQIAIAVENALAYREISQLKEKLAQEKLYLEEEIRSQMNFQQVIGNAPVLRHILKLVKTVAPSDSTVLLLGETGTGKELIARAIHDHSRRKDRTFVKLNCAAIPTGLLESELFGHEKGAFTGAIIQKIGRLELADQGTLFLDEVGDIPLEIQPKLLRVLQDREFERLGSTQTRSVNVRLVAATNRDLESMIAAREFRSDLYYRLNVFPIRIPPLRERREDIPLLVRYFVQKLARQMNKHIETIPAAALKALASWEWPGNVRELENFIERAVILTHGKSLELPLAESSRPRELSVSDNPSPRREEIARIVRETINEMNLGNSGSAVKERQEKEKQKIVRVLSETKGRVGGADGAAARLVINRTTLISRMKKLGIDPKQFSS